MSADKDITEMSDAEVLEYLNSLEDDSDYDMSEEDIKEAESYLKADSGVGTRENSRRAERMNTNARRVFEIKNSYISNNRTTDLYVALDKSILTEIILIKTNDLQQSMDNAKKYVTNKIELCLNKKIPVALKVAYKLYRQSFIVNEGFLYTASNTYGGGKLWIVPNIPYYFEQFSEVGILYKYFEHIIHLLDRNVQLYHKQAAKLLKLESKIATKLNRVKNLIGLLELDVEMYDMYLKIQKDRLDKAAKIRLEEQESRLYRQRYIK